MKFLLLLVSWLIVILFTVFAGTILFLVQMAICSKTDSLVLRLLPTFLAGLLCAVDFHTQIITGLFYLTSTLAFGEGWAGIIIWGAIAGLCIFLGWRQGSAMRVKK